MLEIYTIATKPGALTARCGTTNWLDFNPAYVARPEMELPIVIAGSENRRLTMATWGAGMPMLTDTKGVFSSGLVRQFRTNRCAIPANCFFGMKGTETVLIRLLDQRLFFMGGVFTFVKGRIYFTLLRTETSDVLGFMPNIPVLMLANDLEDWLVAKNMETVMRMVDNSGSYWFDHFPVSDKLINTNANSPDLLRPIGMSSQQQKIRKEQLLALRFEHERPNRSSMKHR